MCNVPNNFVFKLTEFETESNQYGEGKRTLRLGLFYPPAKITIRSEYYTVDMNSLFGNVGGVIGVLLGASILSLLDITLEFVFTKTRNAMKYR